MARELVPGARAVIARERLDDLIARIASRGHTVVGPTMRDGAIVYDEIATSADLPAGWTEDQAPGLYQLRRRSDRAVFGYAVGPHAWRRFLHVPEERLWRARRTATGFEIEASEVESPSYAFFGVRGCDLHAIAIQDRVFAEGEFVDPRYAARRDGVFVVAVNCGTASGTCFCVSMGTGPGVDKGFDLALTELVDGDRHEFVVEVGSPRGAEVLSGVAHRDASSEDTDAAERVVAQTAASMGRSLDTTEIKELLYANLDHPRWDDVASRCLTCANCTLACPTCFCSTVDDVTDLTGEHAERWRRWDSCFTLEHSYIHGGSVRQSTRSRYRQWLTHKLASWIDQYGTSGCVGCGRCITWCPVGIDITEEVRAIRESVSADASGREADHAES